MTITLDTFEAEASTAYALFIGQHARIANVMTTQELFLMAFALGVQWAGERMARELKDEASECLLSFVAVPHDGRYVENTITRDLMVELRMGASLI